VDAVDGTDVHARAVFDVDAGLRDDVRHEFESSLALPAQERNLRVQIPLARKSLKRDRFAAAGPAQTAQRIPASVSSATSSGARSTSADFTIT
jgi:hypothetical protein